MITKFLAEIYRCAPADCYYQIWELASKKSECFHCNPDDWQKTADKYQGQTDIYLSMGVAEKPTAVTNRFKSAAIAGTGHLWLDIDFTGKAESKKKYPPQVVADRIAREILHPSIVVRTGNGYHWYWILNEFLQAEQAAEIVHDWQSIFREALLNDGDYDLDSTHDLARVLRLPCTIHGKTKKDIEIYWPGYFDTAAIRVYELSWITKILSQRKKTSFTLSSPGLFTDEHPATTPLLSGDDSSSPPSTGNLKLDPTAKIKIELINEMCETYHEFAKTWNGDRPEFPSPSEYDLSLATYAANNGFKDQEIVNLIIHWRRQAGHDVDKVLRTDYMSQLIAKSRVCGKLHQEDKTILSNEELAAIPTVSERKVIILHQLNQLLNLVTFESGQLQIIDIIAHGKEVCRNYEFIIKDRPNMIIRLGCLETYKMFREEIIAYTKGNPPVAVKAKKWGDMCFAVRQIAAVDIDMDIDNPDIQAENELELYLDNCNITTLDDRGDLSDQHLRTTHPLIIDDILYINVRHMCSMLKFADTDEQRKTEKQIVQALRRLGFHNIQLNAQQKKGCRYWHRKIKKATLPLDFSQSAEEPPI